MQSNGHYIRTVGSVGLIPDFYVKVAESKDEAERSIEARLPEFEEHGIALVRFIAPAVKGSHNIRILEGKYGYAHEQFLRLGEKLGLRGYISLPEIGDTVVKVLSRNTGPDYIELFGPYLDGCHILQSIYGQEAIYIDTKNTETHTGTMVVNYERAGKQNEIVVTPISRTGQNAIAQLQVKNEHAIGHFNEQMGLSILAGHKRIRAAVETMAQFSDQPGIKMKLRGFECVRFPGIARPGDIVTIDATLINHVGNIYTANVRLSVNGKICTEIEGLKTEAVAGNSRDTLVEDQLIEYAVQSAAVDIFANDSHKMPLFVGIGRASFSGIELTPGVSVTARDHDGKQIGKRGFSVSSEIIDDKGNHVAELFDMEGVLVPSSWAKRI